MVRLGFEHRVSDFKSHVFFLTYVATNKNKTVIIYKALTISPENYTHFP